VPGLGRRLGAAQDALQASGARAWEHRGVLEDGPAERRPHRQGEAPSARRAEMAGEHRAEMERPGVDLCQERQGSLVCELVA